MLKADQAYLLNLTLDLSAGRRDGSLRKTLVQDPHLLPLHLTEVASAAAVLAVKTTGVKLLPPVLKVDSLKL